MDHRDNEPFSSICGIEINVFLLYRWLSSVLCRNVGILSLQNKWTTKRAIRVICNTRYNAHTDPLFKEKTILKIRDIFKLNCLKLYHKYKNQELPNFFNNMFTTNADIDSYHTRRRNYLHYFSYDIEGASKRIWHAIPNIINQLPHLAYEKLSTLNLKQFAKY